MRLQRVRADVNVSVKHKSSKGTGKSYGDVTGLGTRTEIKNINTINGVEDAIRAERDRQIALLESGGVVEAETRQWSLTRPGETRRLRGKEGEVDYRYMPDPDIPPLFIGTDLVEHLSATLPPVPEELREILTTKYGLSQVDARDLLELNDGQRMIYFQEVVDSLSKGTSNSAIVTENDGVGRLVGNWVLHELGRLLTLHAREWTPEIVPAAHMGKIVDLLRKDQLTQTSAKELLRMVFEGDSREVEGIAREEKLFFSSLSEAEYAELATSVIGQHPEVVDNIVSKGKVSQVKYLLGQMMKQGERGRIQATTAEEVLKQHLRLDVAAAEEG
jgi:aspartyl-tRNA(Asn)/glutamyl-tRNA(Gln) amidotransferase subunit B